MASPCVKGTVSGYGADLLIGRDLLRQVGQNRAVALVTRGEFDGTDVAGGRIHRQMDLAILAAALCAMPAGKPFPIAEEFDPGAVHQQVERTQAARRFDICTVIRFCRRLRVEKSGTGQSRPANDKILFTIPVVCLRDYPEFCALTW